MPQAANRWRHAFDSHICLPQNNFPTIIIYQIPVALIIICVELLIIMITIRISTQQCQILNNLGGKYQEHRSGEEVNVPIVRGRTTVVGRTETSLFSAASRCWAAIFSRASRSISCSHSRSLRRSTCRQSTRAL